MTKDQEFKQEFFALLRKYNAEMYVRDPKRKHNEHTDGVSFSFHGLDDYGLTDVNLYTWEDGKEFV